MRKCKIKNVGGLSTIEFDFPQNSIIRISGRNAEGKSSIVKALKLIATPNPTLTIFKKEGEKEAAIEVVDGARSIYTYNIDNWSPEQNLPWLPTMQMRETAFVDHGSGPLVGVTIGDSAKISDWFRHVSNVDVFLSIRHHTVEILEMYNRELKEIEDRLTKLGAIQSEDKLKVLESEHEEIMSSLDQYDEIKSVFKELSQHQTEMLTLQASVDDWEREKEGVKVQITELGEAMKDIKAIEVEKVKEMRIKEKSKIAAEQKVRELTEYIGTQEELLRSMSETLAGLRKVFHGHTSCPNCLAEIELEAIADSGADLLQKTISQISEELRVKRFDLATANREVRQHTSLDEEVAKIRKEIESFAAETSKLPNRLGGLNTQLKSGKARISELQESIEEKDKIISEFGSGNVQEEISHYNKILQETNLKIVEVKFRVEEQARYLADRKEHQEMIRAFEAFKAIGEKLYEERHNQARNRINNLLQEHFPKMGFDDISMVQWREENVFYITRKSTGKKTEFGNMSGAEKALLVILLHYVAKLAYAKEYPYFVIDETVWEIFDESRQRKLVEFFKAELEARPELENVVYTVAGNESLQVVRE